MDITPFIPADRQLIQGYGDGGFTVTGRRWTGSVLIHPARTVPWPVSAWAEVTLATLAGLTDMAVDERPELLLLGCGASMGLVRRDLRQSLREAGMVVDAMDTGAACRTYNVLLAEGRRVAAALIAV
jgi:uncharacterized protein